VDDHVPRPDEPVAGRLEPEGVILGRKAGVLESLVERADPSDDLVPCRSAEKRDDSDGHALPVMGTGLLRGKAGIPVDVDVAGLDRRLPRGPVGAGSDEPNNRVGKVEGKAVQPAGRHDGVVVDDGDDVSHGLGEAAVDACGMA
jgi:hypothetical protein